LFGTVATAQDKRQPRTAKELYLATPPPYSDTGDASGTPRWVKIFGIIALIVVLLVVIVMVAGGGTHGPSRHMPSGDAGHQMPPSSLTAVQIPPESGRW
jgi:hypothetical protein